MKLKLGHQGILMVMILLGLEAVFVGLNWHLLIETEMESRREEAYKEISAKSSRLLQKMYECGDGAGKYSFEQTRNWLTVYEKARDEIPQLLNWLKNELKNSPSEIELLNKIEADVKVGLEVLAEIRHAGDDGDRETSQRIGYFAMRRLQPRINSLCRNQIAFQRLQHEKIAKMPAELQKTRDYTKRLLMAGVGLNILGAVFLGLFFVNSITSRLKVVIDNSLRLKNKEELRPPMKGGDEIAQLDKTFHEMAESLRGEEDLLRASEQQVRSMIEQMPVGLVVTRDKGIEFANPMAEKLFGYSRGELIGKELGELFAAGSETGSEAASSISNWLEDRARDHVVELKAFRKGGEEFPVEFSMSDVSLREGQMFSRRLGMVLDVTERYEVQKMRKEFVAMVSHELRTPLNSVSGFLQLLPLGVFGKLSNEATVQVELAEKNIDQLIGLINDLLDLEKMEAGKMDLARATSVLEDVIDQSINDISDAANEREISPYFEGAEGAVNADPERLQQCITKVLSFMIAFSPQGATIDINAEKEKGGIVTISARSKLLTIPQNLLETIFERFQQLDLPGGRGSTGLGLALAKTIVEQHDGAVRIESTEENGTTIWVHLPG